MVSTLEKRIMLTKLASKCTSPKSCRLCHGPLTSPNPSSPPTRASAAIGEVDCHPSCLPFACPGCVEKDRSSYGIPAMLSGDGRCSLCSEDDEGWNGSLMFRTSRNVSPPLSPTSSSDSEGPF